MIATELLTAFNRVTLPDASRRLYLALLAASYAWKHDAAHLRMRELEAMTGLTKSQLARARRDLTQRRMLTFEPGPDRLDPVRYTPNPAYLEWTDADPAPAPAAAREAIHRRPPAPEPTPDDPTLDQLDLFTPPNLGDSTATNVVDVQSPAWWLHSHQAPPESRTTPPIPATEEGEEPKKRRRPRATAVRSATTEIRRAFIDGASIAELTARFGSLHPDPRQSAELWQRWRFEVQDEHAHRFDHPTTPPEGWEEAAGGQAGRESGERTTPPVAPHPAVPATRASAERGARRTPTPTGPAHDHGTDATTHHHGASA